MVLEVLSYVLLGAMLVSFAFQFDGKARYIVCLGSYVICFGISISYTMWTAVAVLAVCLLVSLFALLMTDSNFWNE